MLTDAGAGLELLVLEGELIAQGQCCAQRGWLRLPAGAVPAIVADADGAIVSLKAGHLATIKGSTWNKSGFH